MLQLLRILRMLNSWANTSRIFASDILKPARAQENIKFGWQSVRVVAFDIAER
jgi:hypothetical protein